MHIAVYMSCNSRIYVVARTRMEKKLGHADEDGMTCDFMGRSIIRSDLSGTSTSECKWQMFVFISDAYIDMSIL